MLVLTLPLVKHFVTKDKIKSGENRNLAQKPHLPKNYKSIQKFINQTDDYLSDQFGFRKNFIAAANKIKFKIFNEISSKQVTVGENNFLFFNSHMVSRPNSLIKSVCGINSVSKKFKAETKNSVINFIDETSRFGIVTNIAIIPTKSRIYPEKLPLLLRKWCLTTTSTWRDELIEDISQTHKIYYPLRKMLSMKKEMAVYLPSYFHWRGQSTYVIAEDMMKSLWQISPEFKPKSMPVQVKSDLRMHTKGLHLYNDSLTYDFKNNGIVECHGKACLPELLRYYKRAVSHRYINENAKNSRTLLIISDSFGPPIAEYFSRGFSQVISINFSNLTKDEKPEFYRWITTILKPSHMLFLIHDGGVFGLANRLKSFQN